MAEWITGLFSSAPSLERVDPIGLIVLILGAGLALFADGFFPKAEARKKALLTRLGGLAACVAGTLIAIF